MKDLIPILYMLFAVCVFVAGFVAGRDAERDSENEDSFFCVQNTQEEYTNTKKQKTSEEEDNRNQFFR